MANTKVVIHFLLTAAYSLLASFAWFIVFVIGLFLITGFGQADVDGTDPDPQWWENWIFIISLAVPFFLINWFIAKWSIKKYGKIT